MRYLKSPLGIAYAVADSLVLATLMLGQVQLALIASAIALLCDALIQIFNKEFAGRGDDLRQIGISGILFLIALAGSILEFGSISNSIAIFSFGALALAA